MANTIQEKCPQNAWHSEKDSLLSAKNAGLRESLMSNPHFRDLSNLAGMLDATLKGIKKINQDGFPSYVSKTVLERAGTMREKGITCVSLTWALFTFYKVVITQDDYEKRETVIASIGDNLKAKGVQLPIDLAAELERVGHS
ncbi:MAG: hypothetical protein AAF556_00515, partial [Pseudomonadota bacterium]